MNSDNDIKPTFHYLGNKAGVLGADEVKKKVEAITQGSEYYQRQRESAQRNAQKVTEYKKQLEAYLNNTNQVQYRRKEVAEFAASIQKRMNFNRVWMHIDMDMFYVAVELLDKPELRDKPCCVGGMSMISTANYVARKFGVRSAMPGFVAKKLCPDLIFIDHNFKKYQQVSELMMGILKEYDPDLESHGLDEANLDITDALQTHEIDIHDSLRVKNFADDIRKKVISATSLTASSGVGPNIMIAKLASEKNKPDGIYLVENTPEKVIEFISDLPVRKIPGIGNVMEQILTGLGYNTCRDVREKADEIKTFFLPKTYEFLVEASWGLSRNFHEKGGDQRSISCQRTFHEMTKVPQIEQMIDQLSQNVAKDLADQKLVAHQVSLTLKTTKFQVKTKQMAAPEQVNSAAQIATYAKQILKQLLPVEPLRLIGVEVSKLKPESETGLKQSKLVLTKGNQDESLSLVQLQLDENSVSQVSKGNSKQSKTSQDHAVGRVSTCPICQEEIECFGLLSRLNKHIDQCLLKPVKQQQESKPKATKSKSTIDQFFNKK